MSHKNNEYSVVAKKDVHGDTCQFVLRESALPTGLLTVDELARMYYDDVKRPVYPEGLAEPTVAEVMLFGGKKLNFTESLVHDSDLGSTTNITEIKKRITSFVLEGLQNGRQPMVTWSDRATSEEVTAFHEAFAEVNSGQISTDVSASKPGESYGLYL